MAKEEKKGDRHHYIPQFYLKQWINPTDPGRRLCEFSRPWRDVIWRMVGTGGTGYEEGLYTFGNLSPAISDYLEGRFFRRSDDRAHTALKLLLAGRIKELDTDTTSSWSRFIMTLLHRSPEGVDRIRQIATEGYPLEFEKKRGDYDRLRSCNDPPTFDEFLVKHADSSASEVGLRVLAKVMDSPNVGNVLNKMMWGVMAINKARYALLTSDRPLVMTNGIGIPGAHIVMPISPRHIFIAADKGDTFDEIRQLGERKKMQESIVEMLNDRIAQQARRFVWSTDHTQLRFIERRLGKRIRCSWWE